MISEEYLEVFNRAAKLARERRFEAALSEWNRIVNSSSEDSLTGGVLTGDFLGQAHLRKAWVLMDLERFEEAREVFASETLEACLTQFDLEVLYDYFYSYGHTLGQLGKISDMDDRFTRALNIASEHLGDEDRCEACWRGLLQHARDHGAWTYLRAEGERCITFAENNNLQTLWLTAVRAAIEANSEAGDRQRAVELAEMLKEQAQHWQNDDLVEEAERTLSTD